MPAFTAACRGPRYSEKANLQKSASFKDGLYEGDFCPVRRYLTFRRFFRVKWSPTSRCLEFPKCQAFQCRHNIIRSVVCVTNTSCFCGLGTWRTPGCPLYLVALLHLPFFFRFEVLV